MNEWHAMPDVEVCRADKLLFTGESPEDSDEDAKKKMIRAKLKVGHTKPWHFILDKIVLHLVD